MLELICKVGVSLMVKTIKKQVKNNEKVVNQLLTWGGGSFTY